MSHDRFHDRLLELAYGELPPKEAREAEAHAASCAECGAELARIRATRQAMSSLPEERAPEAGERILLAAAREAVRDRAPRRLLPSWAWSASVVAALVLAVGAVSYRILAVRPAAVRPGEELLGRAQYAEPPPSMPPAMAEDEARAAPSSPAAAAPSPARRVAPPPAAKRTAPPRSRVRSLADSRGGEKAVPAAPAQASPAEDRRAAASAARPAPAREDEASRVGQADADPGAAAEELAGYAEPPPEREEAPSRSDVTSSRTRSAAPAAASAPTAPRASAGREATPERDRSAEALARYSALRAEGSLSGEIRTFADCEGESWRKVERDPDGRTVKYVREGRVAGRHVRVEHLFGPDGALAQIRAIDLDRGAAVIDPRALGLSVPRDASQAGADAEPRCDR